MATTPPPGAEPLLELLRGILLGLVRRGDRDLTTRQLAVFLICYQEHEPQTVRGLAEKLGTHRTPITRAFDRLEKDKLIRRSRDPLDRRSVLATRTAAGSAFFRELRQIVAQAGKAAGSPG